jgi:hypothetical protein
MRLLAVPEANEDTEYAECHPLVVMIVEVTSGSTVAMKPAGRGLQPAVHTGSAGREQTLLG